MKATLIFDKLKKVEQKCFDLICESNIMGVSSTIRERVTYMLLWVGLLMV